MTDRDRLIELIVNADTYDSYECKLCTKKDISCTRCGAEKLTDYLLANGVIVPPCTVGDKVFIIEKEYRLNKVEHKIITCEIEFIYVSSKTKRYHTKKIECPYMDNGFNFRPKDIGKTVFLTKEEAEEKLKEMGCDVG